MFYSLIQSSSEQHKRERLWMMRLLSCGLKETQVRPKFIYTISTCKLLLWDYTNIFRLLFVSSLYQFVLHIMI